MANKNRSFIGLLVLSIIASILAIIGLSRLFPKMMRRCKEMCEKEGFKPPAFCRGIIDKYCGGGKCCKDECCK